MTKVIIAAIIETIRAAAGRVAETWPSFRRGGVAESLVARVPTNGGRAPGFDAGIACCLDLIPREQQKLAAGLHGDYTPERVEQVRREMANPTADDESVWWLAACSVCSEDHLVDEAEFSGQIEVFERLAANPEARLEAAKAELSKMKALFRLVDGVPFTTEDTGLQGAYVSGYDWGVQYASAYGLFFIGTFRPSLGLENFPFSERKDEQGRQMSGPVWGSLQFNKVSSFEELGRAVEVVKAALGTQKPR